MKAIFDKRSGKWRFGESNPAIYSSEREAEDKGKKEIEINLKKIISNGNKVS